MHSRVLQFSLSSALCIAFILSSCSGNGGGNGDGSSEGGKTLLSCYQGKKRCVKASIVTSQVMQDIRAWIDFTVQKENKAIDLIYSHQDGLYVDGILRPLPWAGKDLNVDTEFYDLGNGWWIGKSSAHIVWLTPDVYDGDNFHYLEWYTFQGTSGELSLSGEGSPPVSLEYDIRIRYPSRYWNKKDGLVEAMVTHYKESDKCGYAITREVMLENIGDGAEVGNACSGPLLYIQKVDVGVFLITPLQ